MKLRSASIETRLTPIIQRRIGEEILRDNFEGAIRLNNLYTVYEKSELDAFCKSLGRMRVKLNTGKASGCTMVIAHNHGRLSHYFHFLLGLFVPLLLFLHRHSGVVAGELIFFPDSGLFNEKVLELLAMYGLSGMPIPKGLDLCAQPYCSRKAHLEPLDIRLGKNKALVEDDVVVVDQFAENFQHLEKNPLDITIIDRGPPEPFYHSVSYRRL